MIKWKNLLLGYKLAISYSVLILVFLFAGFFIGISLNKYKKELLFTTRAYIPLVENTNKIERLTNQSMNFLWEYSALGDMEYYNLSKNTLTELFKAITETDKIISISPQLLQLKSRLMRITNWGNELNTIIDETAEIQHKLQKNQKNLRKISQKFSKESQDFISKEEGKMYKDILNDTISSKELTKKHREIRRINLIERRGSRSMITALEAISSKNPEHLNSTIREFKYIFNLINSVDTLFTESYQYDYIVLFRQHFTQFQNELYSLRKNLNILKKLYVKQVETANVVIYEARAMGDDGIQLSGQAVKDNYLAFNRLGTVYILGLFIVVILAIIFSFLIMRSITVPLEKSVRFAEEIAAGNLDATVQIDNNDEVGILAKSLKNMGIRLNENMANLKKVEREMLTVSIETEEKERKRMAEDLHDSLGPLLSTIKLFINALKNSSLSDKKNQYLIDSTEDIISEAITSAKNIAHNLLPNLLSDFGLDTAIRSFCNQIKQATNLILNYSSNDYPSNYNRKVETTLFRIIKELLNNTIKHAEANQIDISMYLDEQFLRINYSDDGKGFEMDKKNKANNDSQRGLVNIFNRIKYINGSINIESSIGNGINVEIWIDKKYIA